MNLKTLMQKIKNTYNTLLDTLAEKTIAVLEQKGNVL